MKKLRDFYSKIINSYDNVAFPYFMNALYIEMNDIFMV